MDVLMDWRKLTSSDFFIEKPPKVWDPLQDPGLLRLNNLKTDMVRSGLSWKSLI